MDGDLPNFMWIHGLGGERLLVMSYALCPNPKNAYFLPLEIDGDFVSSVFYTPAVKCFFSGRRPPYITGLRVTDPRVGRSP